MGLAGQLGDDHDLSRRARRYANEVVFGDKWPLTPDHVDLSAVRFETSTRMKRRHGICSYDGTTCTVRLSAETDERGGPAATKETIRHELVHVYQHQHEEVTAGHGESFKQWVGPLNLSGRCSTHYDRQPEEYRYQLYCTDGCGFIAGRHRFSAVVERAENGTQICGRCRAQLRVEGPTAADIGDD